MTLPLGISFYTFQSMSYTIDVYRGTCPAMRNFIDFACFVSMFPQLVAGPIIRFSEVADQLRIAHAHGDEVRARCRVLLGRASRRRCCSPTRAARSPTSRSMPGRSMPLDAWYGVTAYAFQIYFDFSGYSDMAIGLGLMFGFVFAKNFDSPYKSQSITEFWRRWHISLSTWLRDYLYVPLGGNRKGRLRTYVNLLVVMLLGGLWHGASWNFVDLGRPPRRAAGASSGCRARRRSMAAARAATGRVHVRVRAGDVGVLPRRRSAVGGALSGVDVRRSARRTTVCACSRGIVYQPYYLLTFVAGRGRDLELSANLGLVAHADGAEGGCGGGGVRPRCGDADDAGVQPVHLLHLLMATERIDPDRPWSRSIARRSRASRWATRL